MRTLNSCCRPHWMMPRKSCRHASPCRGTSTQSTEAPRLASCSPRSTRHRRTTTSTLGDRYGIIRYNLCKRLMIEYSQTQSFDRFWDLWRRYLDNFIQVIVWFIVVKCCFISRLSALFCIIKAALNQVNT